MKPDIRPELGHCVVSVWHSGTRTLVKHLKNIRSHQHFLHYDAQLKMYSGHGDLVHVPVRYPYDVAESWARRGKPLDKLIGQYDSMFRFIGNEAATLHKVEDIPRLAGLDDHDVVRDVNLASIHEYKDMIHDTIVVPHLSFFRDFYDV